MSKVKIVTKTDFPTPKPLAFRRMPNKKKYSLELKDTGGDWSKLYRENVRNLARVPSRQDVDVIAAYIADQTTFPADLIAITQWVWLHQAEYYVISEFKDGGAAAGGYVVCKPIDDDRYTYYIDIAEFDPTDYLQFD